MKRSVAGLQPRLRIVRDGVSVFGPGKADLLHYIAATGSLRTAAGEMRMSYQRAWNLVREMNGLFISPLVVMTRGGGTGGGAALTPTGREVLERYLAMERMSEAATGAEWTALQPLIK